MTSARDTDSTSLFALLSLLLLQIVNAQATLNTGLLVEINEAEVVNKQERTVWPLYGQVVTSPNLKRET